MPRRHRSWLPTVLTFALATVGLVAGPPARAEAQSFVGGLSAVGGGFAGTPDGAVGGAQLRLGFEADAFEMFAQFSGLVGSVLSGPNGGTVQGLLWNSVLLGGHVGVLHLGIGPSADLAWGCDTGTGCFDGLPLFGIDARVALNLGPVVVSAQLHPTWLRDIPVWGALGGVGFGF